MKNIMTLFLSIILPFSVCAQTVTATGDTLEQTEEKIRQQADKQGDRYYKITEAAWEIKYISQQKSCRNK